MKKHWITYSETWKNSPLAFWVHKPIEGEFYEKETEFTPKSPKKELEGFPIYHFELNGFVFEFSSKAQIEHFIEVLSQKVMPTSKQLSIQRGTTLGPNRHWLSRLTAKTKSFKYREKLINYIKTELDRTRKSTE